MYSVGPDGKLRAQYVGASSSNNNHTSNNNKDTGTDNREHSKAKAAPESNTARGKEHGMPPLNSHRGSVPHNSQQQGQDGKKQQSASSSNSNAPSGANTSRSSDNTSARYDPTAAAGGAASMPDTARRKSVNTVARPFSLKCTSIGATMVDLDWRISLYETRPVLIELNWRNVAMMGGVSSSSSSSWESAKKLISGTSCRKKNLEVGAVYEFRVRAIQDLPGGMLGEL
jgi:hypothetical protein